MLSGEGVEGCHVDDISRIFRRKLGVAVRRGVRRNIGSVCVGEIAH